MHVVCLKSTLETKLTVRGNDYRGRFSEINLHLLEGCFSTLKQLSKADHFRCKPVLGKVYDDTEGDLTRLSKDAEQR